jgi:hypothetical protein
LIVSEKTSPQDGFSRNRTMRPSSSVRTIPYGRGFATRVRTIVAAAFRSRWNSTAFERSKSVMMSALMTRNVLSRRSSAILTAPAVP